MSRETMNAFSSMKSYAYGVKNAQICDRRSKMTYFGKTTTMTVLSTALHSSFR